MEYIESFACKIHVDSTLSLNLGINHIKKTKFEICIIFVEYMGKILKKLFLFKSLTYQERAFDSYNKKNKISDCPICHINTKLNKDVKTPF